MVRNFTFPWEYTDDNFNRIPVQRIYDKGKEGDQVVLFGVGFGDEDPLKKLPQPRTVTIKECNASCPRDTSSEKGYVVVDPITGIEGYVYGGYLTPVAVWVEWANAVRIQELKVAGREKTKAAIQLELLKDILKSQGIKLVTKEQLEELGIKVPA